MFTVGMATFQDFDGVYFTVQSLRLHHASFVKEVIVVDNDPSGPVSSTLREYCKSVGVRYIPYNAIQGTAAPRNQVFAHASSDYVICCDSHVLFMPGALEALALYYKNAPTCHDLLSGPMYYDWLGAYEDHFFDEWSGGMWGTWSSTFVQPRNRGWLLVTPRVGGEPARTKWYTVEPSPREVDGPEIDWMDPLADLASKGYTRPMQPFEIPAMGLGVFACRKDAWLGFNPRFKGFGGEEYYIHTKYRQHGRRAICVPGFGWVHRFARPLGVPYGVKLWDKVRNNIIAHQELGLPLDRCREHFVDGGRFKAEWFDAMTIDAETEPPKQGGCTSCNKGKAGQPPADTLERRYERAAKNPSDISEHVPTLRDYAKLCDHVTEFGVRHGVSTVALLAGTPDVLMSYDIVRSKQLDGLAALAGDTQFTFVEGSSLTVDIDPTDLLFIDTYHTKQQLAAELDRHHGKVRKYIILHDTVTFGHTGEDGVAGNGLLYAVSDFIKQHPEWTVIKHYPNNNGLLVMSKVDSDKRQVVGAATRLANFAKAVAKDVATGNKRVPLDVASDRMMACTLCEHLNNGRCSLCGCPVTKKTMWSQEKCPDNPPRW